MHLFECNITTTTKLNNREHKATYLFTVIVILVITATLL